MHEVTLLSSKSLPRDVNAVVVGLTTAGDITSLVGSTPELEKAYRSAFKSSVGDLAIALGASSDLEKVTLLPEADGLRVVVAGLGHPDVTPTSIRLATGSALRTIAKQPWARETTVALSLELSDAELAQAAAEGAALGAYKVQRVTNDPKPQPVTEIVVVTGEKAAVATANVTAAAVYRARDWANLPPNLLFPENFAESVRQHVKSAKVTVEVLDERALEKGGYGGILAVGGGSSRRPRLVRMSYAPRGARFHIALVGKGITFDSGGLDIKPPASMEGMQMDMSGAAIVSAAIKAIADLELKVQVTAYAAMAENMPSSTAFRPGDVLTMFNGKTVENYNTDAEGRLVLADAIARAGLDKPDLIVDVATLTGACMVALGERISGLLSTDDETADRVLDAAEASGEEFWHLPITDNIRDQLKSDIADIRSGGKSRYGGALVAGAFLEKFVADDIAWAHLDIAGPADASEEFGYTVKGGTGVAVRTLIALAQQASK